VPSSLRSHPWAAKIRPVLDALHRPSSNRPHCVGLDQELHRTVFLLMACVSFSGWSLNCVALSEPNDARRKEVTAFPLHREPGFSQFTLGQARQINIGETPPFFGDLATGRANIIRLMHHAALNGLAKPRSTALAFTPNLPH